MSEGKVDHVWLPAFDPEYTPCYGCAFATTDTGDVAHPDCLENRAGEDNHNIGWQFEDDPACSNPDVVAIPKDEVAAWWVKLTIARLNPERRENDTSTKT